MGFIYVEPKQFVIRTEIGVGGIQLAERSRGIFRALVLGRLSIGWLRNSMEALRRGDLKEFCRTYRVGNMVYVLQRSFGVIGILGVEGGVVS